MSHATLIISILAVSISCFVGGIIIGNRAAHVNDPARVEAPVVSPKWVTSDDVTDNANLIHAYILTDTHGQKFVVTRLSGYSGIAMLPYTEPKTLEVTGH